MLSINLLLVLLSIFISTILETLREAQLTYTFSFLILNKLQSIIHALYNCAHNALSEYSVTYEVTEYLITKVEGEEYKNMGLFIFHFLNL